MKRWFLAEVILLLMLWLLVGCGVSQEDYDTILVERDATQAEVGVLQSEVESLQASISESQRKIEILESLMANVESDLTSAESQVLSTQSQLSSLQVQLNKVRSELFAAEEQLARMEAVFGELLFFDDFEDGDAEEWDFGVWQGWSVIQEDNNYLLQGVAKEIAVHIHANIGSDEWTDYTLEFRIDIMRELFWVHFRATPTLSEGYMLHISPYGLVLHKKQSLSPSNPVIAESSLGYQFTGWNDIKVEVYGDNIKVYVNRVLKIDYTDPEPLERGGVNFHVGEHAHIYLDDVLVTTAK